jgi:hypothetical protein
MMEGTGMEGIELILIMEANLPEDASITVSNSRSSKVLDIVTFSINMNFAPSQSFIWFNFVAHFWWY